MASSPEPEVVGIAVVVVLLLLCGGCQGGARPPAMYVFGDSLVDVGNNNHLRFSLLRADFPHNGVDFAGRKATGRFSNGKNAADFFAEKLGLAASPAYLSLPTDSDAEAAAAAAFLAGVNFASGGAGTLGSTNKDRCISLKKQTDFYSKVYGVLVQQLGADRTLTHLSNSIFLVAIGSNDIFHYVRSSSGDTLKNPPQQFVESMVSSLRNQLQSMHNLGAHKFVLVGTAPLGCCPAQRHRNKTGDCDWKANFLSSEFNKATSSMLQQLEAESSSFNYSFFNAYSALMDFISKPSNYGFVEVEAACCGLGELRAKIACTPFSSYCSNRSDHIFWDFYHPTEAAVGMLTTAAMEGSVPYVYPVNVRQLIEL